MRLRGPSWRRKFSPQSYWNSVPPTATQQFLRTQFARWGRPLRLRVDNGSPWGSRGDLPTDLVLWLAGLEVAVVANRPRRPQDNGVVERSQGTAKRWAEPQGCPAVEHLQASLDAADQIQREQYPNRVGRSRIEVFPELKHSGRGYEPAGEEMQWDLGRARQCLAEYHAVRTVNGSGGISVYNRPQYVGKAYRNSEIIVRYDPQKNAWLFYDLSGRLLNTQPAAEITRETICSLQVSLRRKDPDEPTDGTT
jgi:hypothetical protein